MSTLESNNLPPDPGPDHFNTTHWSVVLAAGESSAPASKAALETVCRVYWSPVYAFVRRRGHPVPEAQDLTQAFFCHFLASQGLQSVDRAKGRFRSYLIASLNNFLANEWDKATRRKRGGGREIVSWEGFDAEERFQPEPAHEIPPEQLLDRE